MASIPTQDTLTQSHPDNKQDRAENRMDTHTPSRWSARKSDLQSEQQIRDNSLPSDGAATETNDQPSWIPNPVTAQFPDDLRPLWLTEPEQYAAGVPAVIRSTEHLSLDRSIVRGSLALSVLNQSHGIYCPSCAWPEPDGPRKLFEFCENGAKAVAWERTHASAAQSSSRSTPLKSYRTRTSIGSASRAG